MIKKLFRNNLKTLGLGMLLFTSLVLSANVALACDTPPSSECGGGGGGGGFSPNPQINLDKIGPEYAVPGEEITYTLNWSVEDDSVTNLVLTDPIPAKTTFVSASAGGIYDALSNNVVWNLGSKNDGDSGSITLKVLVDGYTYDTDFIVNTASLDSDETEAAEDTVATEMDAHCVLTINKVDDIDPVQPGEQVTYTIEYQNTGDGICVGTGVMLAEYFDQVASFVTSAPEMPHYTSADLPDDPMPGNLGEPDALWQWTELIPDGQHFMTVVMDVSGQAVDGQILTNKVCIWSENAGSAGGEGTICTTETTTVEIPEEPYFNLAIEKTANKNKVEIGDELTYTIDWQVTGNTIAANVVITDTLPAGINLISASGVYATTSDSVIWNLGDIAANATGTIELIIRVDSIPTAEELANIVKIESGEKSAESSVITPLEYFNLSIDKKVDLSVVQPGDEIIYTINWGITGNATATDVSIYDFLPEGVEIVSTNPVYDNVMTVSGTNYPVYTLVWNLGEVMPNATGTIGIAVITASDLEDGVELENTAKIISGEKSVEDSVVTSVTLEEEYFSLQIEKSGPTEVKVGD